MDKLVMGFNFPMFVFTAALPVGFGLTCIRLARDIINNIKRGSPPDPWEGQIREEILEIKDEQTGTQTKTDG
jgi:TRAP-type C4-dicarboxylate transport system permease small subunit